jgi:hypothetical protein
LTPQGGTDRLARDHPVYPPSQRPARGLVRTGKTLMRIMAFGIILVSLASGPAVAADDMATCDRRTAEVALKASNYMGEGRMKRLIEADVRRARKEAAEGDIDECIEALEHAENLLIGKY